MTLQGRSSKTHRTSSRILGRRDGFCQQVRDHLNCLQQRPCFCSAWHHCNEETAGLWPGCSYAFDQGNVLRPPLWAALRNRNNAKFAGKVMTTATIMEYDPEGNGASQPQPLCEHRLCRTAPQPRQAWKSGLPPGTVHPAFSGGMWAASWRKLTSYQAVCWVYARFRARGQASS